MDLAREARPSREKELIDRIQNGGPSEIFWRTFRDYARKSDENVISEEEQQAFSKLIAWSHNWDAERVALVVELANLRGNTFEATWESLNLEPRSL